MKDEHPEFTVDDWKTLVEINEVRQGYWSWVENQVRHEAGL